MLDTKYGPAGRSAEDKPAWPGARFRSLACGGGLGQSVAPLINFTLYVHRGEMDKQTVLP